MKRNQKHVLLAIFMGAVALAGWASWSGFRSNRTETMGDRSLASASCAHPNWTAEEWVQNRPTLAAKLIPGSDARPAQSILACTDTLTSLGLDACFSRTIANAKTVAVLAGSGNSIGSATSDRDYYDRFGKKIQLPEEVLAALPGFYIGQSENLFDYAEFDKKVRAGQADQVQPESLRPLAKRIQEDGWQMVAYTSQAFGNPADGARSHRRFLIYVPGENETDRDLFVQITVAVRVAETQNLIDVISVDKPGRATPKITFTQFWRSYTASPDGRVTVNVQQRLDKQGMYDRCITCHSNGLRQLNPAELADQSRLRSYNSESSGQQFRFVNDDTRKRFSNKIGFFNQKMTSYGRVDFAGSGMPDPASYGPTLGGDGTPESLASFTRCFSNAGYSDTNGMGRMLKHATSCATCHSNSPAVHPTTLGGIHSFYTLASGGGLQQKVLVERSMPPGLYDRASGRYLPLPEYELGDSDRTSLLRCLLSENQESRLRWMTNQTCQLATPSPSPVVTTVPAVEVAPQPTTAPEVTQ